MTQTRKLGIRQVNGFRFRNGFRARNGRRRLNGLLMKGEDGIPLWKVLSPENFVPEVLGEDVWLDPDLMGSAGVGDLNKITGIKNAQGGICGSEDSESSCVLDNRHMPVPLKHMLCDETEQGEAYRELMDVLLELAWPGNTELWLCCSAPGDNIAACDEPDYVFAPPVGTPMAPHFLTSKFESGQQEALTAALIAKVNTEGTKLKMDAAGRFDLGAAGILTITREEPDTFHHYLGGAWGNMFLDCNITAADPLCAAAAETDREIGRDEYYHGLPMFSCNGESSYPIKESGKSCFSEDMAGNDAGGCDFVAAAGECDVVCVGGMCGVNQPFVEGRGSTNVLYIYMDEFDLKSSSSVGHVLAVALPLLLVLVVAGFLGKVFCGQRKQRNNVQVDHRPAEKKDSTSEAGTAVEMDDSVVEGSA